MSNNGIDWIGGLKICFALLGIAIIIKHLHNRQNSANTTEQNSALPTPYVQPDIELMKWLNDAIHSFERKYCSYLIERNRIEKGYTISQMKELQDKYGIVYAEPTFTLKTEFYEKYPDKKRSVLIDLTKQWLKGVGENVGTGNQDDLNDLVEAIKNKAIQNATEEFKQVFPKFMDI